MRRSPDSPVTSRLPTLGPRGEGWVVLQVVALVLAVPSGLLGPAWDGPARVVSAALGVVLLGAGLVLAGGAIRSLGTALTARCRNP